MDVLTDAAEEGRLHVALSFPLLEPDGRLSPKFDNITQFCKATAHAVLSSCIFQECPQLAGQYIVDAFSRLFNHRVELECLKLKCKQAARRKARGGGDFY